ncbi:uncharacterized protein N7479_006115 [Penicillium vulpinum]|uniref:uncharacterized protein n=1 Tax=Penicillium vulpinum TaxID=29845 RepID=UPI0025498F35|nr:uncharacterized protein N7479_006115 [Penicillium vulpinum]KAJ5958965.1 hypothetical protein N7479_006115 [Penicillium vulpinum]
MRFTPILALAFTAIVPIINAYPITGNVVNCGSGPGTSYSVVKSYNKGANVAITCQAAGTIVNGNEIWDKSSDGCYITDYYIRTGSSSYVTKKCGSSSGDDSSGNLPGLTSTQTKHAKAIIGEAKKESLGRQGGLVEPNMLIYANKKVSASLKYPHDAVGSDYDSVGIFQQRAIYYPDIAADMDAVKWAAQFFKGMKNGSAYPGRYAERLDDAKKICVAGGL